MPVPRGQRSRQNRTSWLLRTHVRDGRVVSSPALLVSALGATVLDGINNSTKWLVSAIVAITLLVRRDIDCAWCVLGAIAAAAVCRALKHSINESRPKAARKVDPGMPSSHANSLAYLAAYVALASAAAPGPPPGAPTPDAERVILTVLVPLLAAFLAWLRVALGFHTAAQVAVGGLVGSATAAAWSALGSVVVLPLLRAQPCHQAKLYAATAVAVAYFAVANVLRWGSEAKTGGGGGGGGGRQKED